VRCVDVGVCACYVGVQAIFQHASYEKNNKRGKKFFNKIYNTDFYLYFRQYFKINYSRRNFLISKILNYEIKCKNVEQEYFKDAGSFVLRIAI
jgi:hypothetical protein